MAGYAPRPGPSPYELGSPAYNAEIADAVGRIRERIGAACARVGRAEGAVTLLAVTKFHPREAAIAAYAAGVRVFGENRVQEAEAKFASLLADAASPLADAKLHLLGHLQSNKAKKAALLFDCVESADSLAIIAELAKRAQAAERPLELLLELHTGEESKSGFADADELARGLELALASPFLRSRGLMTMAPFTDDEAAVRRSFILCRETFERLAPLATGAGQAWDTLSMGMTNDFEAAIEEGSTMVRIGTAIFGERAYSV